MGVAPIRALCRVGSAAAQLAAIPADQLALRRGGSSRCARRRPSGGAGGGSGAMVVHGAGTGAVSLVLEHVAFRFQHLDLSLRMVGV